MLMFDIDYCFIIAQMFSINARNLLVSFCKLVRLLIRLGFIRLLMLINLALIRSVIFCT